MNIATILDELGLDALAPGDPDRPDAGPDGPLEDEEEEEADDGEESTPETSTDDADSGGSGGSGGLFGRGSNDDEDDELVERINDFEYELSEIRNDVEQNEASIEGLESAQLDIGERMEQIEEHNATLLGVYDQLTEGVNPFARDWERTETAADGDGSKYGVIPDDDSDGAARDQQLDRGENGTSADSRRSGSKDDRSPDDDERIQADPEPAAREEPSTTPVPETPPSGTTPPENGPYLTEFADTYATDVLVMEWLAMLIDTAGEEGALKALDHYDRIDWVSESIRRELEVVLSGAWSEADSEPRNDLNTDVHDRSFRFIARLSQQAQLAKTEPRR